MIYWIKKYFSNPSAHQIALYEVTVTALMSLAPFMITYFAKSAQITDGSFISLDEMVGRGQIYILVYGIFGTVFWLAFVKSDKPRHDARAFLGVVAFMLVLPILGFIAVDPTFSTILNKQIVILGYVFYIAMLFINYLLLFYLNIEPPEPNAVLARGADDMRKRYEELNENEQ